MSQAKDSVVKSEHWVYDRSKIAFTIQNKIDTFQDHLTERLRYTQIEQNEAHKVILSRDSIDTFVYADPPYVGSDQGHYGGYTDYHFKRDLDALEKVQGKFLLSSYPSDILNDYINKNGWFTKSIEMTLSAGNGAKMLQRGKKVEVLTANYDITSI